MEADEHGSNVLGAPNPENEVHGPNASKADKQFQVRGLVPGLVLGTVHLEQREERRRQLLSQTSWLLSALRKYFITVHCTGAR